MKKRLLTFVLTLFFFFAFTQVILAQSVGYANAYPSLTFDTPLEIIPSNDGSNRLFILEKPGYIWQIDELTGVKSLILDVSNVVNSGGSDSTELGLLGMALHPDFATNNLFYIYYTSGGQPHDVNLAQLTLTEGNPIATGNSRIVVFADTKPTGDHTHNGGHIEFGPDGYLYMGIGDGGNSLTGGGNERGQELNHIFGKILRIQINTNGTYSIPSGNPFIGATNGEDERIWIYGLRNPWKFSFNNNDIWIGDVGANQQDEINRVYPSQIGSNYGWGRWEGTYEDPSVTLQGPGALRPPYFAKSRSSITGGYVYQGNLTNPAIVGKYVFANYIDGKVWAINPNISPNSTDPNFATNNEDLNAAELFTTSSADAAIVSFGENESKTELYFLRYGQNYNPATFNFDNDSGAIFKITGEQTNPPTPVPGIGNFDNCNIDLNDKLNVIKEINGEIWLGGNFTDAEGTAVSKLVKFNQSTGFSSTYSVTGAVADIHQTSNGDIWIGGNFTTINGTSVNNLAQISNGTIINHNAIGAIFEIDSDSSNTVYFVGGANSVSGVTINGFGRYNGSTWDDMNTTPNNEFRAIEVASNDDIFVGGNFTSISGASASRIARYNGANWGSYIGTGSLFVKEIEEINGYLYVGGQGSVGRYNLANNVYEVLSHDISGEVSSITSDGSNIYLGGSFTTASNDGSTDLVMNNLAQWNPATNEFEALGQGSGSSVGTNSPVNDVSYINNNLYIGGEFNNRGNYFAIWSLGSISCPSSVCPADLPNEDTSVTLTQGSLSSGLDEAVGTSSNTNGSPCALLLSNTVAGQAFTRFHIPINLANNNLTAGDQLFISIDGNSTANGNARIEVNQDNNPNTALLFHNFGNGWSTKSGTITIPSGISTLDLWIFPRYNNSAIGSALFDNLIVQKVGGNNPNICENPASNGGIAITEIEVSSFDTGTGPCLMTDDDTATRWSGFGVGQWAKFDLGSVTQFNQLQIAYFKGNERTATFDIQVSNDGNNWTDVLTGATSSGTTLGLEDFNFATQNAHFVRYFGKGNSNNQWNSITELKINLTGTSCPADLPNEDTSVNLSAGSLTAGLDEAVGTSSNTNGSPCALLLSNTVAGQAFTRLKISIDLASNSLTAGDELFISIDGNSTANGNARIEVNQDDSANSALLFHNFGNRWSTKSGTITIPSGISTLDIWLFPRYNNTSIGSALFDNLIVQKVGGTTLKASLNIIGLASDTQIATIRMYPNPSTNETHVNLPLANDYTSYNLFNLNGAIVKKGTIEQGQRILPITVYDIENGMYLLNISNSKGENTFMKLIKE